MPGVKADQFARFEDQIQRLIEGGFARLFAGRLHPREVVLRLARVMEDHARDGENGHLIAPDVYIVRLHPADHRAILEEEGDIGVRLAQEVVEMARTAGMTLKQVPEVRLLADATIAPHTIIVGARHSTEEAESTQAMPLGSAAEVHVANAPNAVLIRGENPPIPLDRPIINIGRQLDNDIILDDASVSRHHAQIRLRFGQYVIFDLGSQAGTMVNGNPIQQKALEPGDVIALAGVSLIYVEEDAPGEQPPVSDTQPYPPPPHT
jgi:hypothetical protein